jgi:hypothetical protein
MRTLSSPDGRTWATSRARGLELFACVAAALTSPSVTEAGQDALSFDAGAWNIALGGYVKLDVIHDFDAIGSRDLFDPRTIPIGGGDGGDTRVHARATRLSLSVVRTIDARELQLFYEGDFFGKDSSFRTRHAFVEYGRWLVGRTWSTFMDEKAIAPTIDYETPLAAALVRQRQVRVSFALSGRAELAVGLEDSDPVVLPGAGMLGTAENSWPDLTARLRFTNEHSHFQVSFFVGETRFEPVVGATQDVPVHGVLASAGRSLFERDSAYFQIAYGPGLGRYRGAASAGFDSLGNLEPIRVFAVTAGYQHFWSPRWSSNAVVSPASVRTELAEPRGGDAELTYAAVNLRYWFLEGRAWTGCELLHGRRELHDDARGTANRVQLAVRFDFGK